MSLSIKLGLDLGNNTICAVGEINEYIYTKYILSTYVPDIGSLSKLNVISANGTSLRLGEVDGSELASLSKCNRLYLEHQIIWAVHSIYGDLGEDAFELDLAVGLPIEEFINLDSKNIFSSSIKNLGTIKGEIHGKPISININKILVNPEGASAVSVLQKYIPASDYPTFIYDIGFLTTDVIQVQNVDGAFTVSKPITLNKGLSYVYSQIFDELYKDGAIRTKTQLDNFIRKNKQSVKTQSGSDFDLGATLKHRTNDCKIIFNEAEHRIGFKVDTSYKILIGGGSLFMYDILGQNFLRNDIHIPSELRHNANALSYFYAL